MNMLIMFIVNIIDFSFIELNRLQRVFIEA